MRRRRARAVALAAIFLTTPGCSDGPQLDADGPPPTPLEQGPGEETAGIAPETSRAVERLSPDQAAVQAVEWSPRLRSVRARRGVVGSELVAAGILPNPKLAVSVGGPIQGEDGRVAAFDVDLTWEVSRLFWRADAEEAAGQALAAVDLEVAWQEWQVAHLARLRAIRAVFLARRIEVAQRIRQAWEDRLQALERALAVGATTALDCAAARTALDATRLDALELARELARVRAEIAGDLGLADDELVLDGDWSPPDEPPPPLEGLLLALPRRRLDLVALDHGRRSHEAALQVELARRFPLLELGVFAHRDADRVTTTGGAFTVGLPIFDRNQAGLVRETAAGRQVVFDAEAALAEARAEVTRIARELAVVDQQLVAAAAAAQHAANLADLAARAAGVKALSGLADAEAQLSADRARLRELELEQARAEFLAALTAAAGPR